MPTYKFLKLFNVKLLLLCLLVLSIALNIILIRTIQSHILVVKNSIPSNCSFAKPKLQVVIEHKRPSSTMLNGKIVITRGNEREFVVLPQDTYCATLFISTHGNSAFAQINKIISKKSNVGRFDRIIKIGLPMPEEALNSYKTTTIFDRANIESKKLINFFSNDQRKQLLEQYQNTPLSQKLNSEQNIYVPSLEYAFPDGSYILIKKQMISTTLTPPFVVLRMDHPQWTLVKVAQTNIHNLDIK